ncbi:MAG: gamma-glutamyltransferase [Chlorobiaceae bacterium]|nr:gamma-glutamyltransferase [Chlorobiaceae bacterium]MBA4308732.1 gamma-glutamyltransferase [Chlorobiaceae bacterium]
MRRLIFFSLILFSNFIYSQNLLFAEPRNPIRAKNGMVVSANELASKVGIQILKRGGNAIDAAVAVGFALAVTYPVAGNIGGGGFMIIHTKDGKSIAIDFREVAPAAATRNMFLDSDGNFLPDLSQVGIKSAGVPGSVSGLLYALKKYGTMKIEDVIQPAINMAEIGFPLPYSTANSIKYTLDDFSQFPSSMKIFSKNGEAYQEGEIFKQPDLAFVLNEIKNFGVDGFYKGKVAELIVDQQNKMGGLITLDDLANYKTIEREVVRGSYNNFEIISMPPSSSGGVALIQLLNILENFSFKENEWGSSNYIHTLVEAMKYVYADRAVHLGDSDFYNVPIDWLTSKAYAKKIADKIKNSATPSDSIFAGSPDSFEGENTTHYSVYDKDGNAVSVTTTINSGYGSKLVVEGAGFLLNNEMDDFSSKPNTPNQFGLIGSEANSIEPGKRMLSSMTPTIVLHNEKPFLILGSPGGSTIITVVLQVILNIIEFNMDIEQAVYSPRIHHQWKPDKLYFEKFGLSKDVIENLKSMGHIIGNERVLGIVEAIMIDQKNKIIFGVTDKRGAGKVEGY